MTFSPMLRLVHRLTSWYTVAMPAFCASPVPLKVWGLPSTVIEPASILYTPVSALIIVDLPAPFSPIRAWTSPG